MTHKSVSTGKGELLFVEVEDDSYDFTVEIYRTNEQFILYALRFDGKAHLKTIDLPPGTYDFLATTKDISDEQAGEICDQASNEYYTGGKDYTGDISAFHSMSESLRSLLIANKLSPELNYAILKKNQ